MRAEDILYFWFTEAGPDRWWRKSDDFDALIKRQFLNLYEQAARGELAAWRLSERGRLAEILVLDQFPRNMFRGHARSFAADVSALILAQEAVAQAVGAHWNADWLQFLYMPYMHSESLGVHDEAVLLFSGAGLENNLDFEHRHRNIIKRFGRYPHRNEILGRKSTDAEIAFLKEPGSGF